MKKNQYSGKKLHKICFAIVLSALALFAGVYIRRSFVSSGGLRIHSGRPAQRYIVAVDSGHGGADTGAHGLVNETEVALATTQALLDLLEADPAYRPLRVHDPAEKPTLRQRVQTAHEAGAQLFLSLHANKDSHASSYGFECFAVPPGHDWHEESLQLARLIAEKMAAAGARVRGEDGVRYAYYHGGAKMMKESADTTLYSYPTFGVLQNAACPAVLVEQCFITNADDLAAWGDADGCAAAAYCYYQAICAYFGTQPLPAT